MTRPNSDDLAWETDLWIKAAAEHADRLLLASQKIVTRTTADGYVTVDSAGACWITFPGLTTAQGAILFPVTTAVAGQSEQMDPVPPATIGAIIPPTQPILCQDMDQMSGNALRFKVWTSPYQSGSQPNTRYGSQPAKNGAQFLCAGIAWGT